MRSVAVALAAIALAACGGSSAQSTPTPSPSPSPTNPVLTLLSGAYQGTWTNQTFGSSGSVNLIVTADQKTNQMTTILTLGGNVFGAAAPAPETITLPAPTGASSHESFHSKIFGDVDATVTVTSSGVTFTMSSTNVPSDRVSTFQAQGTGTTDSAGKLVVNLTYTVTFKDGSSPANGTATLTKSG